MRHLLVDHARKRQSSKHGSGAVHLTLHEDSYRSEPDDHLAVLALNDAINDIEKNDPVLGQIIECRCFAGLSMQETAEALGMPKRTVERDWQRARGYIAAAMEDRNA
jgi:RNA polymerase sigma factor (TIGR02999 family)